MKNGLVMSSSALIPVIIIDLCFMLLLGRIVKTICLQHLLLATPCSRGGYSITGGNYNQFILTGKHARIGNVVLN